MYTSYTRNRKTYRMPRINGGAYGANFNGNDPDGMCISLYMILYVDVV